MGRWARRLMRWRRARLMRIRKSMSRNRKERGM
jgi:hypothetical protein